MIFLSGLDGVASWKVDDQTATGHLMGLCLEYNRYRESTKSDDDTDDWDIFRV